MEKILKKHGLKLRFGVVGVLNTAIDFSILLALRLIGVPVALANFPSSTAAVIFSFFANKHYAFKSKGSNLKMEITLFLIFTLFCAWVIQPLAILVTEYAIRPLNLDVVAATVLSKLVATMATLIWNYLTYSKYVFISKI